MSDVPAIATLTMNPTIDADYEVERVEPTIKLRSTREQYDPGGGGLNVARVFERFGGKARCFYPSGGATGAALEGLLARHGFEHQPIPIDGNSRVCVNVVESSTGREFRFVPPGPALSEPEWQACLAALGQARGEFLVASGSLPRGVPADFYARVARVAAQSGMRMVLDTSGGALLEGLAGKGIHLVKPSLEELSELAGRGLETVEEIEAVARTIVERGEAAMVAVTMGERGGLLATREGADYVPAIPVETRSSVGAGDSFVAAMVHRLAIGWAPLDAFRFGMAAGSAAVMTPGTDMCRPEDAERLYRDMGAG